MPDEPLPASLKAFGINCSLKGGGAPSSTGTLMQQLFQELARHDVEGEIVRAADYNIEAGVSNDEGNGDAWPKLLAKVRDAEILVIGSPIWLGQPSSIAKRVLERMDAFLSETDVKGRMPSFSKVAVAAIVGNEDGAHWSTSQLFQMLNDVGWTIPATAACYWVGEAMGDTDFKDLPKTPKKVEETAKMVASNAAHLAGLLKGSNYPGT